MNPQVMAVVLGVAVTYYAGKGVVHVAKKVGHAVAHVVHHSEKVKP